MGDMNFRVVPADMTHDQGQWNAASAALGRAAAKAENADTIAFGSFATLLKSAYEGPARDAKAYFTAGETQLANVASNVASNLARYLGDDKDAGGRVRGAGAGSGSGTSSPSGPGGAPGGKGEDHYADLMGGPRPMPSDPKDPAITFDSNVDPVTGEVSWTPREMKPGEAVAIDGRDVERIPPRADRIVVTMVDGEPQITYVDKDGAKGADLQWQSDAGVRPGSRIVPGSGAEEPQPGAPLQPVTEWSRALPEGADYAVAEVRDGEVHLVFLDVDGTEITVSGEHNLGEAPVAEPMPAPTSTAVPDAPATTESTPRPVKGA